MSSPLTANCNETSLSAELKLLPLLMPTALSTPTKDAPSFLKNVPRPADRNKTRHFLRALAACFHPEAIGQDIIFIFTFTSLLCSSSPISYNHGSSNHHHCRPRNPVRTASQGNLVVACCEGRACRAGIGRRVGDDERM